MTAFSIRMHIRTLALFVLPATGHDIPRHQPERRPHTIDLIRARGTPGRVSGRTLPVPMCSPTRIPAMRPLLLAPALPIEHACLAEVAGRIAAISSHRPALLLLFALSFACQSSAIGRGR
jgi:hypothetical protein